LSIQPRRASNRVVVALLVALTAPSLPALADDDHGKITLAETLFQDAKKLMLDGKFAEACPKLVESHKLDPGGGTLLLLAQCHEGEGKLARAWSEYREALAMAIADKRPERADRCKERLAVIEPKLSRVTITVPPEADVAGLVVSLDGVELPRAAFDSPIPIDPGKHVVHATAPDRTPRDYPFDVGTTASSPSVALEPLADAPVSTKTAPASTVLIDSGKPRRSAGWVFLGAAVVGLGIGTVFGFRAIDKRKESDDHCPNDRCDQLGVDLNDSAKSSANVANVAIGLGVVSAIVGGILILGAPRAETRTVRVTPTIGPSIAAISLGVSF
jgi:hypothetical protein